TTTRTWTTTRSAACSRWRRARSGSCCTMPARPSGEPSRSTMHDEVVKAALDRLVPPAQEDAGGWELVERRAGRLRRRRHRTMAGLAAGVSVAVFGTLAAAGQIG